MPNTKSKTLATARFDARLAPHQKELFEQAAAIKGYKSLSDFVIQVVQEAATQIVNHHSAILASEKDKQVFFDALLHPPLPNKALTKAAKAYKRKVA
jgi:uncharacterized protein (DUF1778 family)